MTFPEWLIQRLKEPLPGKDAQIKMLPVESSQRFPIPNESKKSSVLLVLYPRGADYRLLAIRRTDDGGVHGGQMAFPGGKMEPFDSSSEATALREAEEEIRLDPSEVQVLGRLSALYIPVSGFKISPFVGYCKKKPDNLLPSEAEVAEILEISLKEHLSRKFTQKIKTSRDPEEFVRAPVYGLDADHYVWGASAMILSELETLWREYDTFQRGNDELR